MLTRRHLLGVAGAAALTPRFRGALAELPRTRVDFDVPPRACDCHVHVVGDPARFPMAAARIYTPPVAGTSDLMALQTALHFDRVVLVQPSFYGTDNAALLDGLRRLGARRARGVAVLGQGADAAELDDMHAAGVRAIRINLETAGVDDPEAARAKLKAAIVLCAPRGWHIQLYTRPPVVAALADDIADSPAPFVLDHFAGAHAGPGVAQPGFEAVLSLVRAGKAYVKISAPYRVSAAPAPYADVTPLAQAIVAANPARVLWASDWPHTDSTRVPRRATTDVTPFLPIDDGLVLNQLPRWVPDGGLRRQILVDNPARLYGF